MPTPTTHVPSSARRSFTDAVEATLRTVEESLVVFALALHDVHVVTRMPAAVPCGFRTSFARGDPLFAGPRYFLMPMGVAHCPVLPPTTDPVETTLRAVEESLVAFALHDEHVVIRMLAAVPFGFGTSFA
jgi:hypothetical protein